MRLRQIHLDFHTSEAIPGIGAAFSPKQFQDMLKLGHVDSITVFSKCHHGWRYHPTTAGSQHPNLSFDLLRAQIDAAHAIGVKTPIYISAGLDEQTYWKHPEWARRGAAGEVPWAGRNDCAGFHELCLNTGYLDLLLAQIAEVCTTYDGDGIFLDIVGPKPCWCNSCVSERMAGGRDPRDQAAIDAQARRTYFTYTRRVKEVVEGIRPGLPIFHNGGHICRGDRELAHANTHLELESLPTAPFWGGYDHFPLSAGYARTLGMPFLGMTGKFHTWWGEFGGYKHPNALRYEAAACLAQGAGVSIGDQLHPDGLMEPATYALIGAAYAEVETKQPWVTGATSRAEVGVLSLEAVNIGAKNADGKINVIDGDEGVARMLLEGHVWFDMLDAEADFARYRCLVLPDAIRLDTALAAKLTAYVAGGGRIVATGVSGFATDRDEQLLDFGAQDAGPGVFNPSYVNPRFAWSAWRPTASVVYGPIRNLRLTGGEVLAHREDPYFQREIMHFCSHQHTPNRRGDAGPAIVLGRAGAWLAFDAGRIYKAHGQLAVRELFLGTLARVLGGLPVETSLPSAGRLTLMRQASERRDILHLLYATPLHRGQIHVIEELIPLTGITVAIRRPKPPSAVRLAPQGDVLPFTHVEGRVRFTVPRLECHQMVVLAD